MKLCKLFHVFPDKDRISNLDENLLSHILSRLPTKDVVQTSILSKGWRYKWTTAYNMAVKDSQDKWPYKYYTEMFVKFMERILLHSQPQISFRLACMHAIKLRHIQSWISRALEYRLEVLEVICVGIPGIVIPSSLLNSNRLRELQLMFSESTLNVAATNCAPNLTTLHITGVNIVNENHNTSTAVKFNFPLLETFTLEKCEWLSVKSVELDAPVLRTFSSGPSNRNVEYDYFVVVLAPKLATFTCDSYFPEKFILDGSSIVSANIDCYGEGVDNLELLTNIGIRVRNLLNGFKNMEDLHLSTFITEVSRLGPPLQRHDKLRRLTFCDTIDVEQIFQLLPATPSLKILRLNVYSCDDYDYEAMETVPSCILARLEEVVFQGFYCEKPHYNLLKFFSLNGEKLKKLTMCGFPMEKQNEVKEFVSAFRNVEIEFIRFGLF